MNTVPTRGIAVQIPVVSRGYAKCPRCGFGQSVHPAIRPEPGRTVSSVHQRPVDGMVRGEAWRYDHFQWCEGQR